MTGPTIREATRADAAELARLVSPLGYPTTADEIRVVWDAWTAEGNFALVAAGTTSLLGMITLHSMRVLHRARPVGRITSLAVDPAAQRQGIGRALVAAAERVMAERGCGILEVTSHTRRSEAHAYYEHLGYSLTSHRFAKDLPSDAGAMMSRPAVRTFALLLLGFNAAAGSGGSQDTTATQTPTQIIDLDFVLSRAPGFPPFDCTRARRSE